MSKPTILASKISYKGSTFTIFEENVKTADGSKYWYEVAARRASVNIVGLDEKNRVFVTREFRTGLGDLGYKIPGGRTEYGEKPRQAAVREFEEETGYKPTRLKLLFHSKGSASIRWERFIYFADRFKEGETNFDADEDITLLRIPLRKAVQMAWRMEFYSSEIAYAILRVAKLKRKL